MNWLLAGPDSDTAVASSSFSIPQDDPSRAFRPGRDRPGLKADVLIVVGLVAGVVGLHLWVPGVVPSGADGGNWLALAREMFGQDVMSADTSYPPLFIAFLGGLVGLMDPVVAVTVSALVAKTALVVAVYATARPIGRLTAIASSVIITVAAAQTEAYAWGGYPQLLATAFGLMSVYFFLAYLKGGLRVDAALAAVAGLLTAATHLMVGGLLPVALFLSAGHLLQAGRAPWAEWRDAATKGLAVVLPALMMLTVSWLTTQALDVEPVLNPLEVSYREAFVRLVGEAAFPWVLVGILALGGILWRKWEPEELRTVALGAGWAIAGLAFFFVTEEPRSLLLTQLGALLIAGVVVAAGVQALRNDTHRPGLPWAGKAVLIGVVALVVGIMVSGFVAYQNSTDWYRVVDRPELEGLETLNEVSIPGEVVVVSAGHHGNPIGWWVEGYAERPAYTAIETEALMFAEEQSQAEMANRFFSGDLSEEESLEMLDEVGARYVVVDRRGSHADWLDGPVAQTFESIHDSVNLVVLRARP